MDMFNYVNHECECPVCYSKVTGIQSKNGPRMLTTLQPFEVDNSYAPCPKCGCWVEQVKVRAALAQTSRERETGEQQ